MRRLPFVRAAFPPVALAHLASVEQASHSHHSLLLIVSRSYAIPQYHRVKTVVQLSKRRRIANHESPRTTKLYDRTNDSISLDERACPAPVPAFGPGLFRASSAF